MDERSPVAKCKTCKADIVWTVSDRGKKVPMDYAPTEYGKFGIGKKDGVLYSFWLARYPDVPKDRPKYQSHFFTCPDAKKHSKSYIKEEEPASERETEALAAASQERNELVELLADAWGVIASAGGGHWETESKEWQEMAAKWRAGYHHMLGVDEPIKQDDIESDEIPF